MATPTPRNGTDDLLISSDPTRLADGLRDLMRGTRAGGIAVYTFDRLERQAALAETVRDRLESLEDPSLHAVLLLLLEDPGGVFLGHSDAMPAAIFGTKRAERLLTNPEDAARVARALLRLLRQAYTYEYGYGILARLVSRAVATASEEDTPLIEAVVSLVLYAYGEEAKAHRADHYGVPSHQILSWVRSLWESAPRSAPQLFDRLASGGLMADLLAICWAGDEEERSAGAELLLLLLDARKPEPNAKWLDRWASLRARLEPERLQAMLRQLAEIGNAKIGGWGPQAGDPSMLAARGALWALAHFPDDATRDFLAATVLAWARSGEGSPALGNAAIWALARPADEDAARRLLELRSKISHKVLRARLDNAITSLAAGTDLSPDELADRQVPDHGLGARGERTWDLQGYRVTLRIRPDGAIAREILAPDGRTRKSLPPSVREACAAEWTSIARETKELKATIGAQRARLEDAMVSGRSRPASTWRQTVGQHPVLASLARRLVWEITLPGSETSVYGMPVGEVWRDDHGKPIDVPDAATLSVAHPLSVAFGTQARWQRLVVAERIVQPFKQVFRETYVVTPVETDAPFTSTRFAGYPVSLRQIYALARTRGWSGPLGQTFFDGAGVGYREFAAYGVRAVLRHSVDPRAMAVVETVEFERDTAKPGARRKVWTRIRLEDVPRIPFSEAMRDIDLIVSVSAMGTESQWREWDAAREAGRVAWTDQQVAYESSLTETSESRAALLRELLDLLGVGERIEILGKFAFVRGERGDYRVHLGTGNIHLEPSGRYLCIVPKSRRDEIFLPFEDDDRKTSEIISKIVLLAHDSSIRDPAILQQLRHL